MTFGKVGTRLARQVTITGTRSITATAQLAQLFGEYLRPFADRESTFYLGGAVGVDTCALDWLAEHTQAGLVVVVPCTVADQPATASETIRGWERAGRLADVVELRADKLGTSAYYARNRWMVDHSGFVIGFPCGTDQSSGTWYTVNYGAAQGKPRLVVPL